MRCSLAARSVRPRAVGTAGRALVGAQDGYLMEHLLSEAYFPHQHLRAVALAWRPSGELSAVADAIDRQPLLLRRCARRACVCSPAQRGACAQRPGARRRGCRGPGCAHHRRAAQRRLEDRYAGAGVRFGAAPRARAGEPVGAVQLLRAAPAEAADASMSDEVSTRRTEPPPARAHGRAHRTLSCSALNATA